MSIIIKNIFSKEEYYKKKIIEEKLLEHKNCRLYFHKNPTDNLKKNNKVENKTIE